MVCARFRRARQLSRHPSPALLLVTAALCVVAAPSRSAAVEAPPPRVTLIGDSIATAIQYDPDARAQLSQGIDLRLELAPCRRVAQSSCPYNGSRPPTLVDLAGSLAGALGNTVIVAVGYNDFETAYAGNIEDALTALARAGVTRVLWTTLRAERHPYVTMNDAIQAAETKHPELTVVDWNVYSRSHPDWFQSDGLHLNGAGANAMATLFHQALVDLGIPLPPPPPAAKVTIVSSTLPRGHLGRRYAKTLLARGGTRPYRWGPAVGRLPLGLHLLGDGRVAGVPKAVGAFRPTVRVTDAQGLTATRRITLRIAG